MHAVVVLVDVEVQTRQFHFFEVQTHGADEAVVIVDHWPQHLDLGLCYVLLKGFHVEVVKMSEVVIQPAHLLDGLLQIVALQTAVENYVVAQLGHLRRCRST